MSQENVQADKAENTKKPTLKEKIFKVQKEVAVLTKTETAKNNKFEYKYFDINQVVEMLKPVLIKNGITVLQPLSTLDGKPALTTIIMDGSDELSYTTPLPTNPDPQKMGSIITYFRRYALQSLFLLQAQDDDAQSGRDGAAAPVPYVPNKEWD